ncbi:hypothetical protein O163_10360 [Caldanaerobacter subterraneus subsp. yonseiensis KB-1]|uniref:Uncharacterized protein n=1 Tax=Caldanaerobacter subterraneus subsp. yonseiensis KB-1 TaxID=1388761 RepID=U5CR94_CALSX|nr:hypothetical protein [Caldanaerobacter subterraneus]ERM91461.1 hypothetical protein O163_10360 [Caldanaerobacter subterraneus subsp. yonseiensis KB-1]
MPVNVELTERDKKLLEMLAELSMIKAENLSHIYETKAYYLKRIALLRKAHYVRRLKGYVMLGSKGIEYVKSIGLKRKGIPTAHGQKERVQKISDLYFNFLGTNWTFIDSRKLKEEKPSIYRSSLFLGLLTGRTEYAVYNIGKEPSKEKIDAVKSEQEKLHKLGIYRSIVFYESPEARKRYSIEGLGLKEQLLLPYPYGVELLKEYGKRDLIKEAAVKAYGSSLKEPNWKEADFNVGDKEVVVLILNDIEKIAKIKNYLMLAQYRYTKATEVEILCLEEQEEMFREMFPECSIKTIKEEEL